MEVEINTILGKYLSVFAKLLTNIQNGSLGISPAMPFVTRSRSWEFGSRYITINPEFTVDTATFSSEKGGVTVRLQTRMSIRFVSSLKFPDYFRVSLTSTTWTLSTTVSFHCFTANGESPPTDDPCI